MGRYSIQVQQTLFGPPVDACVASHLDPYSTVDIQDLDKRADRPEDAQQERQRTYLPACLPTCWLHGHAVSLRRILLWLDLNSL